MSGKPKEDTVQEIFARRLRVAMSVRDLTTQQRAAAVMGISPALLSLYLNQKKMPRAETLVRMADRLDVSTDWLLGRTQWMHANRERHW